MTPITTDTTTPVPSVRRSTATTGAAGSRPEGSGRPPPDTARPSVVLSLNTSVNQTALSGLTYANPRAGAQARAADAQAQAANAPRTNAAPDTGLNNRSATRAAEREAAQRQSTDRQNLQAAQATSAARQAVAADTRA